MLNTPQKLEIHTIHFLALALFLSSSFLMAQTAGGKYWGYSNQKINLSEQIYLNNEFYLRFDENGFYQLLDRPSLHYNIDEITLGGGYAFAVNKINAFNQREHQAFFELLFHPELSAKWLEFENLLRFEHYWYQNSGTIGFYQTNMIRFRFRLKARLKEWEEKKLKLSLYDEGFFQLGSFSGVILNENWLGTNLEFWDNDYFCIFLGYIFYTEVPNPNFNNNYNTLVVGTNFIFN